MLKELTHTGTVRIETERLILRCLKKEDASQMFKNWANDPEVTKYIFWETHSNIEASESYISCVLENYKKHDYYQWGLEVKETGQLIGTLSCFGISEVHQSGELGYCISRSMWNKGYTSEAVNAVIGHLISKVGLNRVAASHFTTNQASGRVMQKCGMTYEGIRRQAMYVPKFESFVDLVYYSILREDYIEHAQ